MTEEVLSGVSVNVFTSAVTVLSSDDPVRVFQEYATVDLISRGRAEMVSSYLKEKHGLDDSRMVLFWYGPTNPIVPNNSAANQAKNRRVEINVGLGA